MKIVIVTNHSFMLYKFRKELITELIKNNDVLLIMPVGEYTDEFIKLGCSVQDIKINRRGKNILEEIVLFIQLRKIIKTEKPDKVVTYSIKPNIYVGLICRLLNISYYANITGLGTAFEKKWTKYIVTLFYKISFKKISKVFFENESNLSVFKKSKIISEDRCILLNGAGVNLDEYKFKEMRFDSDKTVFIFIGRVMKEKGIDELIFAAKKIKSKYEDRVAINIVGFFEDEYEQIIKELNSKGIIQYLGFKKDVKPYLYEANCLILPSYHEGMANTILEASSCGRAVIASRIPGCQESVVDNMTGLLINPRDKIDLYEKMNEFILLQHEAKIKMGIEARLHIEAFFDRKKIIYDTLTAMGVAVLK